MKPSIALPSPTLDALSSYDYELPQDLIAQMPADSRGDSRLFVLHRRSRSWEHRRFREITSFLREGDLLLLNETRVFPARLRARRSTGGRAEVLLLESTGPVSWLALGRPLRALKPGEILSLEAVGAATIRVSSRDEDKVILELRRGGKALQPEEVMEFCEEVGETPLPPYIRRGDADGRNLVDRERYQTVYAKHAGAVAAPTAGLHFTREMLEDIRRAGVLVHALTLHVGLGTFQPLTDVTFQKTTLYSERVEVSPEAGREILAAWEDRRRVVAVGTTTVRALESFALSPRLPFQQRTDLFIKPGHSFRGVDAMITNFHLPRSSLLCLVSAFAGLDLMLEAYGEAVRERYRFYSYGDAMLILDS